MVTISLLEVLTFIAEVTGFLDSFEHHNLKYNKEKPENIIFFAGIIGYGCNIGIRKMAKISKGINAAELENAVNWYFSVENIHAAIDKILNFTSQMKLPNILLDDPDKLHTSSDGQKYRVAVDSLNANYSFKYLGKDLGVSVYSYTDERDLYFHSLVTSPSDREAIYLVDGLMHNDVVQSSIHSTDTHGYTEAIFGIMHMLKISFTPRIKGLKDQNIYSFKNSKAYEEKGYKILPGGYIKNKKFRDKWDDVLRFESTIKLKKTSASQLFKRLNSYSKDHDLYTAIKCFGEIEKSLFILRNIDSLKMRQSTEKQLNKIENSNKFSKAVSFENNQEFIYGTKEEQEIAEGCRRLIKNALICWNYLYLSKIIEDEKDEKKKEKLIKIIKSGSVATWKHFNFQGEYDFSKKVEINNFFKTKKL